MRCVGAFIRELVPIHKNHKLKNLFLILTLLFSLTASAQTLIPSIPNPQDSIINKSTPSGLKTGLWVEYFYINNGNRIIENTGHYKDGRKIGIWKYYPNASDNIGCIDTSNCIALTEIYENDGSVIILGLGNTVINADSSLIVYTRKNHCEVTCKKNKIGQYECTRSYKSKTMKTAHKTFADFDNCYYNLDTKW